MFICNFTALIIGHWFDSNPGHSLFCFVFFSHSHFPLSRWDDGDFTFCSSCPWPLSIWVARITLLYFTCVRVLVRANVPLFWPGVRWCSWEQMSVILESSHLWLAAFIIDDLICLLLHLNVGLLVPLCCTYQPLSVDLFLSISQDAGCWPLWSLFQYFDSQDANQWNIRCVITQALSVGYWNPAQVTSSGVSSTNLTLSLSLTWTLTLSEVYWSNLRNAAPTVDSGWRVEWRGGLPALANMRAVQPMDS